MDASLTAPDHRDSQQNLLAANKSGIRWRQLQQAAKTVHVGTESLRIGYCFVAALPIQ
jgi:hypothetical protein